MMRRSQVEIFHLVLDALIAIASLVLSSILRINIKFGYPGTPEMYVIPPPMYVIVIALWAYIFVENRVYQRRLGSMFRYRLLNLLKSHLVASLLFFGVLYLIYREFSRLQAFYFLSIFFFGMVFMRIIVRIIQIKFIEVEADRAHVLLLGTGTNALSLKNVIDGNPRHNLRIIGIVPFPPDEPVHPALRPQIIGTMDELSEIVEREKIEEVVIVPRWYSKEVSDLISGIMYELQRFSVNIRLSPDYSSISFFQVVTESFEGLPVLGIRTPILTPVQRLLKRGLDLAIAVPIVVIGFPLLSLIGFLIYMDSPGPILLQQQRVGIHGRTFMMYKFRSMYSSYNQVSFDETHLDVIKRPDDPRVTRVGRFLRRTSLDELPQLLNVLQGDMSLVGPRPELPARVQQYEWWQYKRFEVPQGMTGWWQINGRANRPMHLHTEDDLYYIEHYSVWLDLKILLLTLKVVITGEGAF